MNRIHCARWLLAVAAVVSLASPGYANATLYELSWAYKWGAGDIVFDASVPDSNPDPNWGDHFGSIVSYDMTAWSVPPEPIGLVGDSGAISVQNRGSDIPGCANSGSFCPGATLTFQLGAAAPPYDPAGWHLTLSVPWELGNFFDRLPTQPTQFFFLGSISPNTPNGQLFFPIIDRESTPVTLKPLVTPVPEPATVVLLGLGLAALATTRKRRSSVGVAAALSLSGHLVPGARLPDAIPVLGRQLHVEC
jgi:hypothetical protein